MAGKGSSTGKDQRPRHQLLQVTPTGATARSTSFSSSSRRRTSFRGTAARPFTRSRRTSICVPNASDGEVRRRHVANLKRDLADQASSASASAVPSARPAPHPFRAPPSHRARAPPSPPSSAPPRPEPSEGHTIYPWIVVGAAAPRSSRGAFFYGVGGRVRPRVGVVVRHHVASLDFFLVFIDRSAETRRANEVTASPSAARFAASPRPHFFFEHGLRRPGNGRARPAGLVMRSLASRQVCQRAWSGQNPTCGAHDPQRSYSNTLQSATLAIFNVLTRTNSRP